MLRRHACFRSLTVAALFVAAVLVAALFDGSDWGDVWGGLFSSHSSPVNRFN